MLRWHLIDLTYFDLNETKKGARRDYDNRSFVDRPDFDSLSIEARGMDCLPISP